MVTLYSVITIYFDRRRHCCHFIPYFAIPRPNAEGNVTKKAEQRIRSKILPLISWLLWKYGRWQNMIALIRYRLYLDNSHNSSCKMLLFILLYRTLPRYGKVRLKLQQRLLRSQYMMVTEYGITPEVPRNIVFNKSSCSCFCLADGTINWDGQEGYRKSGGNHQKELEAILWHAECLPNQRSMFTSLPVHILKYEGCNCTGFLHSLETTGKVWIFTTNLEQTSRKL